MLPAALRAHYNECNPHAQIGVGPDAFLAQQNQGSHASVASSSTSLPSPIIRFDGNPSLRAAQKRKAQEDADPTAIVERQRRLAEAERTKLQELQGKTIGRLKALNQPVPLNLQKLSFEALQSLCASLLPQGFTSDASEKLASTPSPPRHLG